MPRTMRKRKPFASNPTRTSSPSCQTRAANNVRVVLPLRSEDFGQRHFIVSDPGGVLVDVITPIEPSVEFAAAYAAAPTT